MWTVQWKVQGGAVHDKEWLTSASRKLHAVVNSTVGYFCSDALKIKK